GRAAGAVCADEPPGHHSWGWSPAPAPGSVAPRPPALVPRPPALVPRPPACPPLPVPDWASASDCASAPVAVIASTAPETELRRNSRPERPASSRAGTTISSPSATRFTFVPAVTYRPASTVQASPSEIPTPALAPS